ncbi:MAG: DUF6279 family lipoprotein [Pseudomonadales bacterium]
MTLRVVINIAWVILLAAMASGCSIKLAYNNADRLIRWGIDDYVDLTREQRDYLAPELERLLYWHRTTQLPRYARTLQTLQEDIDRAVGGDATQLSEQFGDFIETALTWGELVQDKAQRTGSQMLTSLTAEQIEALPKRLDKDNRELAKEERGKTLEQSQRRWAKEVRKGLQRFTGRLTAQQRSFLDEQALGYQPERELWVAYRQRWQEQVLALLELWRERRIDAPTLVRRFRTLTDARESYYGDFGPVFDSNEVLARNTLAGLLVRMNAAQRERFADRLLDIVEDLEELVAQADPSAPAPLVPEDCLVLLASCPGVRVNP